MSARLSCRRRWDFWPFDRREIDQENWRKLWVFALLFPVTRAAVASFKWDNQRDRAERIGDFLIHFPKPGSVAKKSERYSPEQLTVLSTQSKLLSGMPDYVPVVE